MFLISDVIVDSKMISSPYAISQPSLQSERATIDSLQVIQKFHYPPMASIFSFLPLLPRISFSSRSV